MCLRLGSGLVCDTIIDCKNGICRMKGINVDNIRGYTDRKQVIIIKNFITYCSLKVLS